MPTAAVVVEEDADDDIVDAAEPVAAALAAAAAVEADNASTCANSGSAVSAARFRFVADVCLPRRGTPTPPPPLAPVEALRAELVVVVAVEGTGVEELTVVVTAGVAGLRRAVGVTAAADVPADVTADVTAGGWIRGAFETDSPSVNVNGVIAEGNAIAGRDVTGVTYMGTSGDISTIDGDAAMACSLAAADAAAPPEEDDDDDDDDDEGSPLRRMPTCP